MARANNSTGLHRGRQLTGLGPVHMPDVALSELAKREGMHLATLDQDLKGRRTLFVVSSADT